MIGLHSRNLIITSVMRMNERQCDIRLDDKPAGIMILVHHADWDLWRGREGERFVAEIEPWEGSQLQEESS